jgi:NADH-quinone oxidoreductase subunit J
MSLIAMFAVETEEIATNFFFYIIAIVAVLSALKMVTTDNVVHSALWLLIVLAAVAAVYVFLGAEFAAATQILVYIGAILVLLLFGVMLTRAQVGSDENLNHPQPMQGLMVAVIMGATMAYALFDEFGTDRLDSLTEQRVERTDEVADAIFSTYIVPFEAISVLLLAALIGAIVVARRD